MDAKNPIVYFVEGLDLFNSIFLKRFKYFEDLL